MSISLPDYLGALEDLAGRPGFDGAVAAWAVGEIRRLALTESVTPAMQAAMADLFPSLSSRDVDRIWRTLLAAARSTATGLAACPFCGGDGALYQDIFDGEKWMHVRCVICEARGKSFPGSVAAVHATEAWNRRKA